MASISELIGRLQGRSSFPVQVDEIADYIKQSGLADHITYYAAIEDEEKLFGTFFKFTDRRGGPYADPEIYIEITHPKNANVCWKRFICCKELLHAFDHADAHAKTMDEIAQLATELISPFTSSPPEALALGQPAKADMLAEVVAICILAPLDAVAQIESDYKSGKRDSNQVAQLFRIPEYYVPLLFDRAYATIYNGLCSTPQRASAAE